MSSQKVSSDKDTTTQSTLTINKQNGPPSCSPQSQCQAQSYEVKLKNSKRQRHPWRHLR